MGRVDAPVETAVEVAEPPTFPQILQHSIFVELSSDEAKVLRKV